MIIIPGPASRELGEEIASELGVNAYPVERRVFPDGESYIRVTAPVEGETAVIVQTTSPPQDTNMMQLFMLVATAADLGAERVICFIPYLAYARQDKRFLGGEALSFEIVIHLLEESGADDFIIVDAHSAESLKRVQERYGVAVKNVTAAPLLAEHLKALGYGGAYSLAPDRGAVHLAEAADAVLGGGYGFFEKRRSRRTGEIEMTVRELDIRGRDAAVFDDIISSGGTMARAVAGLKAQGARRVAVACTHALFMGDAERLIMEAGGNIIVATDTVATKFSQVSVARLVAECLKTMTR